MITADTIIRMALRGLAFLESYETRVKKPTLVWIIQPEAFHELKLMEMTDIIRIGLLIGDGSLRSSDWTYGLNYTYKHGRILDFDYYVQCRDRNPDGTPRYLIMLAEQWANDPVLGEWRHYLPD